MKKKYTRNFDQISRMVADTEQFFAEEGVHQSLRMKVDLAIEELFVNMVEYNTETHQEILLEMSKLADGIEVSLTDYDVERFDPTLADKVDITAPLPDRVPGGLGLYLVLKMADSIHYEYHNRTSKITFTNRIVPGEAEEDV